MRPKACMILLFWYAITYCVDSLKTLRIIKSSNTQLRAETVADLSEWETSITKYAHRACYAAGKIILDQSQGINLQTDIVSKIGSRDIVTKVVLMSTIITLYHVILTPSVPLM